MTIPSSDDQVRNAAILGPTYQGLTARYTSNFSTQWQVFALGLTAQGFVVGAASQVTDRVYTALLLSFVIVFIGLATIISSLRIGLFTVIDRIALDNFERVLLVGDLTELRLLHKAKMSEREAQIADADRPGMGGSRFGDFAMRSIVRRYSPTFWWVVLESVISIAGAAIPILGIFRL